MFRFLERVGRVDALLESGAPAQPGNIAPKILFWGALVPGSSSTDVARLLAGISRELGEEEKRRTEPDVIVVWPDLTVVVEANLSFGAETILSPGIQISTATHTSRTTKGLAALTANPLALLVAGAGFEPATFGSGRRRSLEIS